MLTKFNLNFAIYLNIMLITVTEITRIIVRVVRDYISIKNRKSRVIIDRILQVRVITGITQVIGTITEKVHLVIRRQTQINIFNSIKIFIENCKYYSFIKIQSFYNWTLNMNEMINK